MKKLHCGILLLCAGMLASAALADTLELKNGSVIKGTYVGGNENQISFRVGANVQQYDVADVSALRFDSRESGRSREFAQPPRDSGGFASRSDRDSDNSSRSTNVSTMTVPTGTRLLVRTIEPIDSAKNRVGDKFSATLEEALYVDNVLVAPRGSELYGRLDEAQEAGHISGKSQLKLSLTGIVINGQTVALSTGDYELSGKSRGSNTAKKVGGGAAVGAVIGAIAGGGKGAAIGAGVGAGAGTAVQVVTRGDQVHVPSETLLEFSIDRPVSMPVSQAR
jgi:hypothetical protein